MSEFTSAKKGEYIYLYWDYGSPDYEVIRGHVSMERALELLKQEGIPEGVQWKLTHTHARWIPVDNGTYDMMISLYHNPGRGAFPVTLMEPQ